jgi:hypothetical protein
MQLFFLLSAQATEWSFGPFVGVDWSAPVVREVRENPPLPYPVITPGAVPWSGKAGFFVKGGSQTFWGAGIVSLSCYL